MRLLVVTSGAKRALEIGAASGYSAIWIGLGMRETGGKLVTIEYDKARAQQAAANIKKAGLSDVVQVISGDAFAEIPKVTGTFDFVFCDAWKRDYQKFFSMVFPRMDKGGLFLGHNVINKKRRDGRLPEDDSHQPCRADLDRLAVRRRNVGYPEALAIRSRRNTTSAPTRPHESRRVHVVGSAVLLEQVLLLSRPVGPLPAKPFLQQHLLCACGTETFRRLLDDDSGLSGVAGAAGNDESAFVDGKVHRFVRLSRDCIAC